MVVAVVRMKMMMAVVRGIRVEVGGGGGSCGDDAGGSEGGGSAGDSGGVW
jgi:hypothetical protein